jgi:ribulose-phosphate 3-epimerase
MNKSEPIQIIPTCVPQSAADIYEKILVVKSFSSALHLDIDDGKFTPEASWPFNKMSKKGIQSREEDREVESQIKALDIPVDNFLIQVHLMVSGGREHLRLGENFIQAGVQSVIIHCESSITPLAVFTDTLGAWSLLGVKEIGVAILLDTPLEKLDPLLPFCDFIQVLSVSSIGAQGATFDLRAIERVKELRTRFPSHPIAVDGGVSLKNIASLVQAGATRFAVGSAIAQATDQAQAYTDLKAAAESTLQ